MKLSRIILLLTFLPIAGAVAAPDLKPAVPDKLLFDFEDPGDLKAWSHLELPGAKTKEPAAKWELSTEHATSGKHSLKITFAGGRWPTVTTTQVPEDWMPYWTFKADVTASRHCLVGFTALQEKSKRGGGWDATVTRWTKTAFLKPGKNEISALLHDQDDYWSINKKNGKVVRFEIFMYNPRAGESIFVDNIRMVAAKEVPPASKTQFKVLGTDLAVSGVRELGQKLADRWTKPEDKSVEQVESDFKARYDELKKKHPKAVLAILRDGAKGHDPASPDKVYAGWKDAYWSSHGPDGETIERTNNRGKDATHEMFMRHRSPLMRVDLSSIPAGSDILAAELVIVRARAHLKEHDPYTRPTMWVCEACNRPWEEYEVNTYEHSRDKFWKANGGGYYGEDPDFLPVYVAYGPGRGKVNVWDFKEAVKFWTDGKQTNHGFMLHGDGKDYSTGWAREAPEVKNRPAVLVAYEPK
jgi:hypothetical protein